MEQHPMRSLRYSVLYRVIVAAASLFGFGLLGLSLLSPNSTVSIWTDFFFAGLGIVFFLVFLLFVLVRYEYDKDAISFSIGKARIKSIKFSSLAGVKYLVLSDSFRLKDREGQSLRLYSGLAGIGEFASVLLDRVGGAGSNEITRKVLTARKRGELPKISF